MSSEAFHATVLEIQPLIWHHTHQRLITPTADPHSAWNETDAWNGNAQKEALTELGKKIATA